jgi:hypothetical protein
MELKEAIDLLKAHNIWRRYDGEITESPKMLDPKQIGIAIDVVVNNFELSNVKKCVCDYPLISFYHQQIDYCGNCELELDLYLLNK